MIKDDKFAGFLPADGRLHGLKQAAEAAIAEKSSAQIILAAEGSLPSAMLGSIMDHKISTYEAYECQGRESSKNSTIHAIHEAAHIERAILACGRTNVAAVVVEPLLCSSRGLLDIPSAYFLRVRNICDRYEVRIIWDESNIGVGTSGYQFVFEKFGVTPDISIITKTAWNGDISPFGLIFHTDFEGIEPNELVDWAAKPSDLSAARVRETDIKRFTRVILGKHRLVVRYHQAGLMGGLSIGNGRTGRSFSAETNIHQRLMQLAGRYGIKLYVTTRSLRDQSGDHLFYVMPDHITTEQCHHFVKSIRMLLDVMMLDLINSGHHELGIHSDDDGISSTFIPDTLDAEIEKNAFFRMPPDITKAS